MRKSLWIMLAALFVAIGAPATHAGPIKYSATFNCPSTAPLCDGSTPTAPAVSFPSPSLMVTWFGIPFDLVLVSADAPGDTYTWFAINEPMINDAAFGVSDLTTGFGITVNAPACITCGEANIVGGTLVFTPVTTPEPSSLLLFGTSLLGLAPFRRKLFGR